MGGWVGQTSSRGDVAAEMLSGLLSPSSVNSRVMPRRTNAHTSLCRFEAKAAASQRPASMARGSLPSWDAMYKSSADQLNVVARLPTHEFATRTPSASEATEFRRAICFTTALMRRATVCTCTQRARL